MILKQMNKVTTKKIEQKKSVTSNKVNKSVL